MTNKTCPRCKRPEQGNLGARNSWCNHSFHSTHPPVAEPATPPQAGQDDAATRLLKKSADKYGDKAALMSAAQHWFNVRTAYNAPWNLDMERPTTEQDVADAEAAMLKATPPVAESASQIVNEAFLRALDDSNQTNSRRLEWLHSDKAKDADGWEYGVMKVKFSPHGQVIEGPFWTRSDSSDIDAAMQAIPTGNPRPVAEPATPPQAGQEALYTAFMAGVEYCWKDAGDVEPENWDDATEAAEEHCQKTTPPVAESAPSALEPYAWFWSHNKGVHATGNDGVLTLRQDYEQHKRDYPGMEFTPVVLQADAEAAIRKARDQYHYWHALALELCERECFSVCRNINADGSCPMDIERRKAMTDKTESAGQDFCEMCKSTDEAAFHSPCRDGIPHNWHFKNLRYKSAPQPAPEQHREGNWCKDLTCRKCYGADTWKKNEIDQLRRELFAATQRVEAWQGNYNRVFDEGVETLKKLIAAEASLKEREATLQGVRAAIECGYDLIEESRADTLWGQGYEAGQRLVAYALASKPEGK